MTTTASRNYTFKPTSFERNRQMTFAARGKIDGQPPYWFHNRESDISAKPTHLLKYMMTPYATDQKKSMVTARSTPPHFFPNKVPEGAKQSAFSSLCPASREEQTFPFMEMQNKEEKQRHHNPQRINCTR